MHEKSIKSPEEMRTARILIYIYECVCHAMQSEELLLLNISCASYFFLWLPLHLYDNLKLFTILVVNLLHIAFITPSSSRCICHLVLFAHFDAPLIRASSSTTTGFAHKNALIYSS